MVFLPFFSFFFSCLNFHSANLAHQGNK
jgi:hypothetical protein